MVRYTSKGVKKMSGEEEKENLEAFGRIQVLEGGEITEVLIKGQIYMRWLSNDEAARRMAVSQLYETGKGTQEEIARAFGIHINSVYNYVNSYKADGIKGLVNEASGPKEAWKITAGVKFKILEVAFRNRRMALEEITEVLEKRWKEKISINSVRRVLIEAGVIDEKVRENGREEEQGELFEDGEFSLGYNNICGDDSEGLGNKLDVIDEERILDIEEEVKDRRGYSKSQRMYIDRLERDSAEINIEKGDYSAYAGGLLFLPLLKRYDYISLIKRIIKIKTQEGYSLEELSKTLFYYDVFGFSSVENFKTVYSEEFGILIGKSSAPSIYTIRRFMEKVRGLKCGERLMEEFGKGYLKSGLVKWGVLYIDEHFLPYHGVQTITMGWFTVRNKPLKGGCNFLSVDEEYNPFIFLVRPSSEDLVEKIPELIKKAKVLAKESGIVDDKLTVIFDREGYSAELFRELSDEKSESCAKFISWAKYADTWVNEYKEEEFSNKVMVKYKVQEGDKVEYFETERQMSKYGKIRAIVIMSGRKKQRTAIYTNDKKSSAEEIINLICTRWGQENLHKALKANHYIDYFPGKGLYDSDEVEEQPMVGNREVRELKQERAAQLTKLNKLKVSVADKVLNLREQKEIKEEETEMVCEITSTEAKITLINEKIDKLPKEIKFEEAHNGTKLYDLDYEKKRFLDSIKIFSYHMQKQMCAMLLNYYDKKKEIWPAMRMIVNRGGNVRLEKGKLVVRLKRFSDPEIDNAARHLCEDLNRMSPVTLDKFQLPMRYEVV